VAMMGVMVGGAVWAWSRRFRGRRPEQDAGSDGRS
jgi:hypothetical protein